MYVTEEITLDSTEGPTFEFSDYTQRVIVATLFLIVVLLGIFGNSLVILAVLLSKKVRTATNVFVVNLSVADFLTCLVIPLNAVALLDREGLPVDVWFCGITAAVQSVTVGSSVFSLVAIGLNRLLLITRPATTYHKVYTPKKIIIWLVLMWLIPLLFTLPYLSNMCEYTYNPKYHTCAVSTSIQDSFNIIAVGVFFATVLTVIVVCYALIWRHLKRHSKRMLKIRGETSEHGSSDTPTVTIPLGSMTSDDRIQSPATPSSASAVNSSVTRRQKDITKNMFCVVCTCILCSVPYFFVVIYDDSPARPYLLALLFFNSCVNPIIYATKHRDFKTIFGCILRRQLSAIPEPSDFLKFLQRNKCCGTAQEI